MAENIKCKDCGKVCESKKTRQFCPSCIRKQQSERAKRINLNRLGNDAYSEQQKRKKEQHG